MIPFLSGDDPFPPVDLALQVPNGLLAAGADLSTERILGAYAEGIFPWFGDDDPILWWSPDPRMVLYASDVHVSRSLGKVLRSDRLRVTADTAFADVVRGCAEVRRDHEGTWITAEMEEAYNRISMLAATLTAEELLTLDSDTILRRLFWEETVRRFDPQYPRFACTCSRERVGRMLLGLGRQEVDEVLAELGGVEIGCEFCGNHYVFDAVDVGELFTDPQNQAPGSRQVQ